MAPKARSSGPRGRRPAVAGGAHSRFAGKQGAPANPLPIAHRLATWTIGLLFVAVPFVLDSAQKDAFRLPKALLCVRRS